jgi:hypothetical protein
MGFGSLYPSYEIHMDCFASLAMTWMGPRRTGYHACVATIIPHSLTRVSSARPAAKNTTSSAMPAF